MSDIEIRGELINFFLVAVFFLIGVALIFYIFCKRFKFNSKNIDIYGLLLNLNTTSLLAISTTTINYLFLVWCTVSFRGLNVIYVAITLLLVIIGDVVIDNFNGLFVDLGLTAVNCGAIQIICLIYRYLTTDTFSFLLLLILGLVILFIFLYYTYNLLRTVNNIVVKEKYFEKKKYIV